MATPGARAAHARRITLRTPHTFINTAALRRYATWGSCAIGLLGVVLPAHADDAVKLYGILDTGIAYFNNQGGKPVWAQSNGVDFPTTIGLLGNEDLGGGLSSTFRLETAFRIDTGAFVNNVGLFNKEASVGLSDNDLGSVRAGRLQEFTVDMAKYVAAHGSIFGFHPGNFDRIVQSYLNNAVAYESQERSGFQYGAMYSIGSTESTATNTGRAYAFKASYKNGPLQGLALVESINGVTINPAANGLPSAFGLSAASTVSKGIALDNLTIASSALQYSAGPWQTIGNYSYTRMSAYAQVERLQTGELEEIYQINPAWSVGSGYTYSVGMGGRWHIYNASTHYALSKRTTLYLDLAYERVTGAGQNATLLYSQAASGSTQLAIACGIKHRF